MRLIGVILLLGACHTGSAAGSDAPGEPVGDAPHGLGMFVSWSADPSIPGGVTDKITVSEVTFQVDHLQLLADSGSVMRSKYLLSWDGGTPPPQDVFPDAPPGVYSKIALVMMSGNLGESAYRIRGTWRDNGIPRPFGIRDRGQLSVSIDCNETLSAASSVMIAIKINLENALTGINFKGLDFEDGILDLHEGPELAAFRNRLQQAFELVD